MAFCAIRLRPALYLPKSHKCSATRASRYEGTQQRQNIFARGAEVGCESDWQDDVSVRWGVRRKLQPAPPSRNATSFEGLRATRKGRRSRSYTRWLIAILMETGIFNQKIDPHFRTLQSFFLIPAFNQLLSGRKCRSVLHHNADQHLPLRRSIGDLKRVAAILDGFARAFQVSHVLKIALRFSRVLMQSQASRRKTRNRAIVPC